MLPLDIHFLCSNIFISHSSQINSKRKKGLREVCYASVHIMNRLQNPQDNSQQR